MCGFLTHVKSCNITHFLSSGIYIRHRKNGFSLSVHAHAPCLPISLLSTSFLGLRYPLDRWLVSFGLPFSRYKGGTIHVRGAQPVTLPYIHQLHVRERKFLDKKNWLSVCTKWTTHLLASCRTSSEIRRMLRNRTRC